jgi:NodT family efflux transporter outer membrane factor (OMF) lipoprotein
MRASPLLLLALLSACTVGPNYAGPPKPLADGSALPASFARGGEAVSAAAPPVAQWWSALGDATLDTLEARALASNPDVAVAKARVLQARSALRLERANAAPKASALGSAVHAELPDVNLGSNSSNGSSNNIGSLDFYNIAFDASWEADLFGGQRRTVEADRASLAAAEARVSDAQVQLTAEVAQTYVNLRDRQNRLALGKRSIELQRRMLDLTRQRAAQGTASTLDVERLDGQLGNSEAQLLPLANEIDSYLNALAVLTGSAPGALDALLTPPAALPLPPTSVAIGDPAALLQHRPDIRAAERTLAEKTARIGVAEASRFPRLTFTGLIGFGGTSPGDAFDPSNLTALAMPQLQWNFLDFGRAKARVGQAQGARDEAEAQYRATVLKALQDAEDSLSRFGHRRATVARWQGVKASADRASVLVQQRYKAGTISLIDALDSERTRIAVEQNLAAATAALTNDFVALQKSLGLGWQAPSPG